MVGECWEAIGDATLLQLFPTRCVVFGAERRAKQPKTTMCGSGLAGVFGLCAQTGRESMDGICNGQACSRFLSRISPKPIDRVPSSVSKGIE